MIAFIDTEVNPQTKKVADYGAVREDGAVLHSHSKADFDAFVSKCDTLCGHNIINFDLKYTSLRGNPTIVDTLFLSPLLFPKRPYHHLVKDDKLQVDELNNPVNDSMKARDLLNDEHGVDAVDELPSSSAPGSEGDGKFLDKDGRLFIRKNGLLYNAAGERLN